VRPIARIFHESGVIHGLSQHRRVMASYGFAAYQFSGAFADSALRICVPSLTVSVSSCSGRVQCVGDRTFHYCAWCRVLKRYGFTGERMRVSRRMSCDARASAAAD
jgi:hypothetical protein